MDTDGEVDFSPQILWSVYRVPILLGCVSLLCIALSITIFIKAYQSTAPISFSSEEHVAGEATTSADGAFMLVDVEGAIIRPGVYRMPPGSRVEDAIAKAGGLAKNADTEMLSKTFNRAAKLSDGAKVYIPIQGDRNGDYAEVSSQTSAVSGRMNINAASKEQLDTLSGVGPVTADKIIVGRPYLRLEELVEKKVMSQSVFEKLKDQLTL